MARGVTTVALETASSPLGPSVVGRRIDSAKGDTVRVARWIRDTQ